MADRAIQKLIPRRAAAKRLFQNQKRNCFTDVSSNSVSAVRLIANAVADRTDNAPSAASVSVPKTIDDLPGPSGYPVVGTAPEYFRKANRGQMHEVQVRSVALWVNTFTWCMYCLQQTMSCFSYFKINFAKTWKLNFGLHFGESLEICG